MLFVHTDVDAEPSMRAIAREAGVGIGILYRHFPHPEIPFATKNGMLDTLLAMIESGEIAHAETQAELLGAIDTLLNAGRATGALRADVAAEDIAASLIGIFAVSPGPEHAARAGRQLSILMDGLRPTPSADRLTG